MIELLAGAVAGTALGAGYVLARHAWLEVEMLIDRLDEETRKLEQRVRRMKVVAHEAGWEAAEASRSTDPAKS